jgi:hypothetical protein
MSCPVRPDGRGNSSRVTAEFIREDLIPELTPRFQFSWVTGRDFAVLPAQGMLVLIGRAGDVFTLRLE